MVFRKRRFRVLLMTLICDEDLLVGSHKGRKLSKLKKNLLKNKQAKCCNIFCAAALEYVDLNLFK
jgi:hypothetical protein